MTPADSDGSARAPRALLDALAGAEQPGYVVRWEQEVLDAAVYRPLPQSTAVLEAAAHLRQAIVLCLLPAGSKLPSEPVLAERLGIGVVTMRTALAMLRDEGFITTTRGRNGGSWIADDDDIVRALAHHQPFSMDELRNTIDMLVAVETQSMGLAAQRATPAEREEITALAAYPREQLTSRDWQMYANVFHLRIANATHNPKLAAAVRAARARLQELRTAATGRIVFCIRSGEFHSRVADCIVRGDGDEARRLCFEFLTSCWDCNLAVIECPNTSDEHAIDPVDGALGALRYTPSAGAAARRHLRLVDRD